MKRMTRWLAGDWLPLLTLAVVGTAVGLGMPHAADRVPMQWGLDGRVTWAAPKSWGLWVIPVMMGVLYATSLAFEWGVRSGSRSSGGDSPTHLAAVRAAFAGMLVLLGAASMFQLAVACGMAVDGGRVVPAGVGLLLVFLGNLFGKLQPNRYVGIRVPWTMRSEAVWRKTHRVAGWLWVLCGLAMVGISLTVNLTVRTEAGILLLVLLIGVPIGVAWKASRREAG